MKKLKYNEEHHQNMSNYFWLLVFMSSMLFFPILSVFFQVYTVLVFKICVSFVILWGTYTVTQSKSELAFCSILALMAMSGIWMDLAPEFQGQGKTTFRTLTGVFYFSYLGRNISIQLVQSKEKVNLNMVYGAITCFLIIGFIGGELCTLLDIAQPGTFFEQPASVDTYKYYYFSFVTLSTLGYGDITPNNPSGQALSLLIALFGQIYLTIIMAIIIGKYLNGRNKK